KTVFGLDFVDRPFSATALSLHRAHDVSPRGRIEHRDTVAKCAQNVMAKGGPRGGRVLREVALTVAFIGVGGLEVVGVLVVGSSGWEAAERIEVLL
ncbi:MAG: hypothetical protein KGN00_08840, partial [Chloroflexota bacterium]|nr:hypothetical protein [Chloroflexota bacterium]